MRYILSIIGAGVLIYYAMQPPMHILDFVMYFVTMGIIWFVLDKLFGGEFTNELGGLVGLLVLFIATIIYIALFVFGGVDWIDIFHGKYNVNITDWFRW
jgi:hypothetical protein